MYILNGHLNALSRKVSADSLKTSQRTTIASKHFVAAVANDNEVNVGRFKSFWSDLGKDGVHVLSAQRAEPCKSAKLSGKDGYSQ